MESSQHLRNPQPVPGLVLNLHSKLRGTVVIPVVQMENRGPEKLSNLPQVTQLVWWGRNTNPGGLAPNQNGYFATLRSYLLAIR